MIEGLSSFNPVKIYSIGRHVFLDPSNIPLDISSRDSDSAFYSSNYQNKEFRYLAKSEFTVRTDDIDKLQKALSEFL